jgi:hypothetical protein
MFCHEFPGVKRDIVVANLVFRTAGQHFGFPTYAVHYEPSGQFSFARLDCFKRESLKQFVEVRILSIPDFPRFSHCCHSFLASFVTTGEVKPSCHTFPQKQTLKQNYF